MSKSNPSPQSFSPEPSIPKPKSQKGVSWIVKLFVAFHLIAITSWSIPTAAPGVESGVVKPSFPSEWLLLENERYLKRSPTELYLLSTGMWQSWDMFSPNPASSDIYCDANVYFANGNMATYQYPRMYVLPLVTKYIKERYRKFFEHANTDSYLFEPFAKRIAYLYSKDPNNPVVKVVVKRHWYDIPKSITFASYSESLWNAIASGRLGPKVLMPDNPPVPSSYKSFAFYEYVVPKVARK